MSPILTSIHRANLPSPKFLGIITAVGRERSHHRARFGSKAGTPAMTRREQGLTRRHGGRPIYWQTLGVTRHWLIAERRLIWWCGRIQGVASGGSPPECSSKGQGLRLLALVGFAVVCLTVGRRQQRVAADRASGYIGRLRSLRLAVQDAALSRQKQGFESPRECQSFSRIGNDFRAVVSRRKRRDYSPAGPAVRLSARISSSACLNRDSAALAS